MTDEQTSTTPAVQGPRTIANRYTLTGELGRGGMGVVWRAEDTVIGRQVAVKELRLPEGAEDAGVFQERVLREVRTGGRLNDPAVVTVYDVVAAGDDSTCIVMELVEAPTLSELVRGHGPLPPQQVASIGLQVLSALRAAHNAGIVHRDVKPGNIMVASNGWVKLTDFGIAQAIDDPRLTTSGMLVGSPAFMAPERVAGREALPASDLWSLGATLFFAVEGSVPFERATTAATLHAIMNEVPYLARAQGPLASAIMGLLIAAPEARLSADQVHALLSTAAQHAVPHHATPSPMTPPGGQPTVRHTGVVPGVGGSAMPDLAAAPVRTSTTKRNAFVIGGSLAAVALLLAGFFLGKPVWSPTVDEYRSPTLTYGRGGDIGELNVDWSARCLNTPISKGRSLSDSNWVDCEEPHDAELVDRYWTVGGTDELDASSARYPGEPMLRRYGEAACELVFHSNRVRDEMRAELTYRVLVPTEAEWEKSPESSTDDAVREVLCFTSRADGGRLDRTVRREVE